MTDEDKTKAQPGLEHEALRRRLEEAESRPAAPSPKREKAASPKGDNLASILFDSITDYITVQDTEHNITAVNGAVERFYSKGVVGKKCYQVFRGIDVACPDCPTAKVFSTGRPTCSVRPPPLGGEEIHLEVWAFPVRDEQGKVVAVLEQARDVTERKRAEEALRRSEGKYAALVEHGNDGIVILQDGLLKFANSMMVQLTRRKPEEAMDKPFLELVAPEHREMVADRYRRRIEGEPVSGKYEIDLIGGDGTKVPVEINASLIEYEGRPAVMAIVRDMTEHKRAEAALEQREFDLREAQRLGQMGSWSWDAETDTATWSDELYRIYGRDRGLPGRRFAEQPVPYTAESWERLKRAVERSLATGEPHDLDLQLICGDGASRWIHARAEAVRDAGGRVTGLKGTVQDITERRSMEDELRREKQKLSLLFTSLDEGVVVTDLEGKVVDANPAALRFAGAARREEVLGQSAFAFISPADQAKAMAAFWQTIETGHSAVTGITLTNKNVKELPAEVTGSLLRDGLGVPVGVIGVLRDVTDRRKAEAALEQSERNLRMYLEQAPDGIYVAELNGVLLYGNARAEEITGYKRDELIGKRFGETGLIPSGHLPAATEFVSILNDQGRAGPLEVETVRKDGRHIWVSVNATVLQQNGQRIVVGFMSDITARKRTEETLVKLQKAVDTSGEVIFLTDRNGTITHVNSEFQRLYGFSSGEVVGRVTPRILKSGRMSALDYERFWQTLLSGGTVKGELVNRTKDGRIVHVEGTASPIVDDRGNVMGFLAIQRDIAERKRMQEQLLVADRLASIGELASGVAHEVNNPLTSVIGFSQLLLEKEMPDEIREDVSIICSEAERAAQVVRSLLTFARKHAVARQPVNVNTVIEKVLELRAYEQKVGNVEVVRHLAADLPDIMADHYQLQQVFFNIIINAEYFMIEAHKGGTLTVTTERAGSDVLISFADDGPGMSGETLNHLFTPFFTTKEIGKGTGLGLSICHGIVTAHGGRIHAESEPGAGATFTIELPIS